MIPINIAITGHRDLEPSEIPQYKDKVKSILRDLQNKYPNTKLQILTGMAEGADILCAKCALELGCSLVAVLPMAKADFINTFYPENTAESIPEFEEVLSKADKVIDLSKVYTNRETSSDAYVQLGVYLTENSQMIIALWNEVHNGSIGGTSSVIQFALEGMPRKYRKKYSIIDSDDTIPVHYIKVKRKKEIKESGNCEYIKKSNDYCTSLYPSVWSGSDINQIEMLYSNQLKKINDFNKNSNMFQDRPSHLKGANDADITSINGMNKIIDVQKCASNMAGKWQKRTFKLTIRQLVFGFFVFFWVAFFDEIMPFFEAIEGISPYILFLSPIFFLLCVLTFKFVKNNCIEERYYDYRALAECLRVQFYWKSVGIKDNAYSNYSRKNEHELGWIISAAKNISMDINYELCINNGFKPDFNKVKQNWMDDQLSYFNKKNIMNKDVISRQKKYMNIFFFAGLFFVIFLIFERLILSNYIAGETISHLLLFLIDFSLAGGAVFSGYLDKRQFEAEMNQYIRMVMIYRQGIKEFNDVLNNGTDDEIKDTIVEIGVDALDENADWVILNKMSSIDIPMG